MSRTNPIEPAGPFEVSFESLRDYDFLRSASISSEDAKRFLALYPEIVRSSRVMEKNLRALSTAGLTEARNELSAAVDKLRARIRG